MNLIQSGKVTDNKFSFDEILISAYKNEFSILQTAVDSPNPHLPFFHLKNSGFWHHEVKLGKESLYNELYSSISQKRIRETIEYAFLDDELFELLKYAATRELLKFELYENVDEKLQEEHQGGRAGWSKLECELITADYLNMLYKELSDEDFVKSHHRQDLIPYLEDRSEGSIEYKYQNISAILIDLGLPYIKGYKPAYNYQKLLFDVVQSQLSTRFENLNHKTEEILVDAPIRHVTLDWKEVLEDSPEISDRQPQAIRHKYTPRVYDYSQRESENKRLGARGEEFVIEFEKKRLEHMGRVDLAEEIEWTSKKKGDGAGYDIRSFNGKKDEELYIEVKTTNSGKYQPFYMSDNEVAFSEENPNQYSLYRVFEFRKQPRIFTLNGSIHENVFLIAKQYQATFK